MSVATFKKGRSLSLMVRQKISRALKGRKKKGSGKKIALAAAGTVGVAGTLGAIALLRRKSKDGNAVVEAKPVVRGGAIVLKGSPAVEVKPRRKNTVQPIEREGAIAVAGTPPRQALPQGRQRGNQPYLPPDPWGLVTPPPAPTPTQLFLPSKATPMKRAPQRKRNDLLVNVGGRKRKNASPGEYRMVNRRFRPNLFSESGELITFKKGKKLSKVVREKISRALKGRKKKPSLVRRVGSAVLGRTTKGRVLRGAGLVTGAAALRYGVPSARAYLGVSGLSKQLGESPLASVQRGAKEAGLTFQNLVARDAKRVKGIFEPKPQVGMPKRKAPNKRRDVSN